MLGERVGERDPVAVGELPELVLVAHRARRGARAEERPPEPRALLVGPVDEAHGQRRRPLLGDPPQHLHPGHHVQAAVEPAAVRHRVDVPADQQRPVGLAREREPLVPGLVDLLRGERALVAQPLARPLPGLGPGDALRAVLVAGQLLELAQLLDRAGGVERHGATIHRWWTTCVIVGGGAIGVCCALELAAPRRAGSRCSSAGRRSPPAARPGTPGSSARATPSRSRTRPRSGTGCAGCGSATRRSTSGPGPAVLPWLARFALAARHWEDGARAIRALSLDSLELHARWGEELGTSFERTGTLNVYETRGGRRRTRRTPPTAPGSATSCSTPTETRELEPALIGPVAGAVRYPDEGRVDPKRFVEAVGRAAADAGAEIRTGVDVTRAPRGGDGGRRRRRLVARARPPPARGRQGLPPRLRAAGGRPADPELDPGDLDDRDAACPDRLRLSGTLELAGLDLSISQSRVDTIRRGGDRWFRGLAGRPVLETWAGLRPCLPDGLPAIGAARPHGRRDRPRDEGHLARAGHREARRAARRRRGARPRPGARSTPAASDPW